MINWIINLLFHIYNRSKYFILDKFWDFQYTKYYWRLRRIFHIRKFDFLKFFYNIFYFDIGKISFSLIKHCYKIFLKEFFFNTGIYITCLILFIGLCDYLIFYKALNYLKEIEKFNTFLISIGSSSVILLGLYFSSITNVAQKIKQQKLKKLILRDPIGRVYMYSLIGLTVFCFLAWFFPKSDNLKMPLTLFAFLLFAFLIIIFPRVATNSFFISDLESMIKVIWYDIDKLSKIIRNKGFNSIFFNSIHFHDYVKKQIERKLDTIKGVLEFFFSENKYFKDELIKSFEYIFSIQVNFSQLKPLIDDKNGFFNTTIPYSELKGMYENTTYKNIYWIEDKILELFLNTVERLEKENNIIEITDLTSLFSNYFPKHLGYSWDVKYFYSIFPKIKRSLKCIIFNKSLKLSDRINLLKFLAWMNSLVAFESCRKIKDTFDNISHNIDQTSKALFNKKISVKDFFIKPFCDDLFQKLQTEYKSSGKVTPKWFLNQVIAKKYSEKSIEIYESNFESLKNLLDDFCLRRKDLDINENFENSLIYYHVLEIRIKSLLELKGFRKDWIQFTKKLKENQKISTLEIPVMEEKYLKEEIDSELLNCYTKVSEELPYLYKPSLEEDLSKNFDEAYFIVRDQMISLLIGLETNSKYQENFEKCFKNLFSTLIRTKNIGSLTDMVVVSSYILLFSEIYKKPDLIKNCVKLWEDFFYKLEEDDLSKSIELFIKNFIYYRNSTHGINLRVSKCRNIWEGQFRELLIKKGYKKESPYHNPLPRLPSIDFKNLQFALKNYSSLYLMEELFVLFFLEEKKSQIKKSVKQFCKNNMHLYEEYERHIESLKK